MTIRPEEEHDIPSIRQLIYDSFLHHPAHAPGALPTEHKILDALRDSGRLTLSLVMEIDGVVIAQVTFSPVQINGQSSNWYGIGPVAVAAPWQRQGMGSALIRAGLEKMKNRGASGIVLLGDPKYYSRFGFQSDARLTLDGYPAKAFQILPFEPITETGNVAFDPAFDVK